MAPLSRACESTRNIGGCSKMHRSSNFARLVLTAGFLLCLVASNVSATDGIDDVGREQECDAGGNCSLADDEGKSESDSNCIDLEKECERIKFKCFDPAVMANMLSQCPKTCGACAGSPEIDGSDEELDMRTQICEDTDGTQCSMEECAKNPEFMLLNCKQTCRACVKSTSDFGKPQTIPAGTENEGPIRAVIRESIKYMREIRNNAEYASMWNCKNKLNECSSFASMGGCRQTPELMNEHCAPACQTCHHHYWKVRCPLDPNAVDAIQPGGVDDLFESIISKYKNETAPSPQVQVLSRPLEEDPGPQNGLGYVDGPWVLVIDNFLKSEETERFLYWGNELGYGPGFSVGKRFVNGTHAKQFSSAKTSKTARCVGDCRRDPVVKDVESRISNISQAPAANLEDFLLTRYDPGGTYKKHHDYRAYQRDLPCGVRTLTQIMYLTDVEEGGETHFSQLNVTVRPKRNRLLLFSNVQSEDASAQALDAIHESLPVTKGEKIIAVNWVHMRNFHQAKEIDCI